MEKYYVNLTVVFNDGTADKKGIYDAESPDDAVANYHKNMCAYVNKENVVSVFCEAYSSLGKSYERTAWTPSTIAE